ncbi:MAG: hypothetical protein RIR73_818 [Chloroflexota bacterium]
MGLHSSDRQTAEGKSALAVCFFYCLTGGVPGRIATLDFPVHLKKYDFIQNSKRRCIHEEGNNCNFACGCFGF